MIHNIDLQSVIQDKLRQGRPVDGMAPGHPSLKEAPSSEKRSRRREQWRSEQDVVTSAAAASSSAVEVTSEAPTQHPEAASRPSKGRQEVGETQSTVADKDQIEEVWTGIEGASYH